MRASRALGVGDVWASKDVEVCAESEFDFGVNTRTLSFAGLR